jgi:glycosyltransferase involved in cell wall biosynthesis
VGGREKFQLLNDSKGLIFPVRWHEPFGLAIIESLYFGCPVFGTPYGSLPEIVTDAVGHLSNKGAVLAEAIEHSEAYSRRQCHEYARDRFSAAKMATAYLEKYERVLSGAFLNAIKPSLQAVQPEKFLPWTP